MRIRFILLSLSFALAASAQHCPWDCSGLILLKTDVSREEMLQLQPVLCDGSRQLVIDSVYGSGATLADTCRFLAYEDFRQYRISRTTISHWYKYDTVYSFAKDLFLVKYSYCRFKEPGTTLYIRYRSRRQGKWQYNYIAVPETRRVHLHNYYRELNARDSAGLRKQLEPFVLQLDRARFGLR